MESCVVEVCNGGEENAQDSANKYDVCSKLSNGTVHCSQDQQAYAKKACIDNLEQCGLASIVWVDACVVDVCAAFQGGDPDAEQTAQEACGPCGDFPEQCSAFTTTTTTPGTTLTVTAPPISCRATRATPLDFRNSILSINNLGGHDTNTAAEDRYSKIAPGVDLVVTNISFYGDVSKSGKSWKFGRISQQTGITTEFQFQFVEEGTYTPKILEEFYFSFFDIDEFLEHNNQESLTVSGYDSYMVEPQTDLLVYPNGEGGMTFKSQKPGWGCDNPNNPETLGWVEPPCCDELPMFNGSCYDLGYAVPVSQRNRSVALIFQNRSSFTARFSVSGTWKPGTSGRFFLFSGESSLVDLCSETVQTTTTTTINSNQVWPLCSGTELIKLQHPGVGTPWYECVVPASLQQCDWYNKMFVGGVNSSLHVGGWETEGPNGCFFFDDGTDSFMGWNEQQGGNQETAFTHRLCCGEGFLRPTTTTTTGNWIPYDECIHSVCDQGPYTYDLPETGVDRPADAIVGTCMAWGDPHFLGFDVEKNPYNPGNPKKKTFDMFETGVFWIVNSPSVWVQGYYASASLRIPEGSRLRKVAIGGPFLGKDTIMIDASTLWWNSQRDLLDFNANGEQTWTGLNGVVTAISNAGSETTTVGLTFPQHDINISISIAMQRYNRAMLPYMSTLVTMRQVSGQDGHCGCFNKDSSDDTQKQIMQRWGDPVHYTQELIPH